MGESFAFRFAALARDSIASPSRLQLCEVNFFAPAEESKHLDGKKMLYSTPPHLDASSSSFLLPPSAFPLFSGERRRRRPKEKKKKKKRKLQQVFDTKEASLPPEESHFPEPILTCARLERRAPRGAAAGRPVPRKAARDVACFDLFVFLVLEGRIPPGVSFSSRLREHAEANFDQCAIGISSRRCC